jgi:hypothetical protein
MAPALALSEATASVTATELVLGTPRPFPLAA